MWKRGFIAIILMTGIVLVSLFLPSGHKQTVIEPTTPCADPEPEPSALQREIEFATGPGSTNRLSAGKRPMDDKDIPLYYHKSFAESLIDSVNPESLRKYEGSYTVSDLHKEDDTRSPSLSLNTGWILGGSTPRAGLKVERNPVTGRYEVSGGELFLPEPGMGVSYEKNEETGETHTFFNLKRSF